MSHVVENKPVILVVDDTIENIDVMKEALISDYIVRPAPSGAIALKAANITPRPNLVLLDIMMPDMDGYEVCRRLKANEQTRDIPVIFVTAKSEVSDELEGLKFGAVDYITKPFSVPIVQARVKTHLALKEAQRKLDKQNQHLLHERELIENIILKMRDAETFDERNLRHIISPVEKAAGDMLLSVFAPDGRQLVLLGDFTGHGLTAAIGGPLVAFILHEMASQGASGEDIIKKINSQLCAKLPVDIFFAAMFLEVSSDRKQATLWNAAIPDGLLMREGKVEEYFPSKLMPLGISNIVNWAEASSTIHLQKGDYIFAFSDGIVEAKNQKHEMFGMGRLVAFLEKSLLEEQPLDDLMALLEKYVGSSIHDDDITLFEVQV
jgi:two-component system, HptB-dependent secretion and biofilm response regulator